MSRTLAEWVAEVWGNKNNLCAAIWAIPLFYALIPIAWGIYHIRKLGVDDWDEVREMRQQLHETIGNVLTGPTKLEQMYAERKKEKDTR